MLVVVLKVLVAVDGICCNVELGLAPLSPRHAVIKSAITTRAGDVVDQYKGWIMKTNPVRLALSRAEWLGCLGPRNKRTCPEPRCMR